MLTSVRMKCVRVWREINTTHRKKYKQYCPILRMKSRKVIRSFFYIQKRFLLEGDYQKICIILYIIKRQAQHSFFFSLLSVV